MLRKSSCWLIVVLLYALGLAAACMAADPEVKTSEKRDTLIYVRTDPPGAKVYLDGKELGKTNGLFSVEEGVGTIILELEGHGKVKKPVTIRANGITRIEIELKPQGNAGETEASASSQQPQTRDRRFVRIVAGKDSLTFEGTETTQEKLPALLEKVSNRKQTVLEVAMASNDLSDKQRNDAFGNAVRLAQRLGFEYVSDIGVHPLGSKGSPSQKIGAPAADTVVEGDRFIGRLPQGTVELIGIANFRPTAQSQWWRPDGSAAQLGPFLPQQTRKMQASKNKHERAVTFLVGLKDLPADASGTAWDLHHATFWEGDFVVDPEGDIVPNRKMLSAAFDASIPKVNLRVGVSMGAWETVISQKPDNAGSQTFSRDGQEWKVTFQKATEGDSADKTQVKLTSTVPYPKMSMQLMAVADDGSEHATSIGFMGEKGTAVFQNLPLSSIKEFRIQVRPYHWVEFKNVSLQPGQKTDVKVVSVGDAGAEEKKQRMPTNDDQVAVLKGLVAKFVAAAMKDEEFSIKNIGPHFNTQERLKDTREVIAEGGNLTDFQMVRIQGDKALVVMKYADIKDRKYKANNPWCVVFTWVKQGSVWALNGIRLENEMSLPEKLQRFDADPSKTNAKAEATEEPAPTEPPKKLTKLESLLQRASNRAQAGDYLRAHVALNRIDELRGIFASSRGVEPSADEAEKIKRLAEDVAAHLDLTAVEFHEDYVLYRKTSDNKPWADLLDSLKGKRGLLAMRVFLEDPSLDDAIQLQGERGCNMMHLDSMSNGAFEQIADGEPAVVSRTGGNLCRFNIGTLRHASPSIEAPIPDGEATALGDIVLLRPHEGATGNLSILLDASQAEKSDSDSDKPLKNRFILGRITAGGKYGLPVSVSDGASYSAGSFAPGKLWIVWAANPRQRWQIDLPVGETTLVHIAREPNGSLGELNVSRTTTPSQPSE